MDFIPINNKRIYGILEDTFMSAIITSLVFGIVGAMISKRTEPKTFGYWAWSSLFIYILIISAIYIYQQ